MKQQNVSILTENEFSKTKSSPLQNLTTNQLEGTSNIIFPKNQRDFIYGLAGKHGVNTNTVNKVYENPDKPGNKLLAIGAVRDYCEHGYNRDHEHAKGNERCHSYDSAYTLELVDQVVEQCSQM